MISFLYFDTDCTCNQKAKSVQGSGQIWTISVMENNYKQEATVILMPGHLEVAWYDNINL